MPIQTDTLNRGLYDLLTVRYDDVTPLDSKEKTTSPEEADIFKFTFEKDGETYGKVYVTIDNSRNLILYYGDEVEDSPDTNTSGTEFSDSWSSFRNMLKQWSQRKQLDFELKNKNHLAKDMAQRTYNKEKENLGESYYPMGKRGSYSDAVPNVKIIIQHTRQIGEGEQRYRNIDKIFVENTMGERFAVPSNKPGIAKVYARHIAEGGSPYDDKGRHITSLVEEYIKMAGFVRATKNKQFNESTNMLIQEGVNHYQSLRETLSRMIGRRGYHAYFEAWQPILSEEITEETNLNELFVQETIDPRIESVMPILSKLYKKVSEMKEINQLEAWANKIIEETTDLKTIPEEELDEGKGAIRKFLAGLGIMGALGAYISSEDEAILQKMAVKYDQAQTPQERAQIKHDIERVTKGSLVKEEDMEEGYTVTRGIDKERYQERQGLEGPFSTKRGKVVYYDKREGKYYDPDTDMYIEYDDWKAMNEQGVAEAYPNQQASRYNPNGTTYKGSYNKMPILDPEDPVHNADRYGPAHDEPYEMDFDKEDLKRAIAKGMSDLPDTAKRVIELRFWEDMTYEKVASELGLSKERIRQIEAKALRQLKHPSRSDRLRPFVHPEVAEDLDANQKRVGQLGPYEKVGPQGAVGKLVGAEESIREGQEDLDTIRRLLGEGLTGELIGGTVGGTAGALAGSALGALAGGPAGAALGGVLGGAAGGTAGQMMGRDSAEDNKLSEAQLNEFAAIIPAIAAGARVLLPLLSRAGPALGRMASTAGKAGAQVAGKAATGVGKGALELGKSAAQSTAQNAGKVGLGAGVYSIADEIGKSIPQGLNKVYTDATSAASALTTILGNAVDGKTIGELATAAAKYAIPLGMLLAVLYGGKKLIDQVMSEGADDTFMGSIGQKIGSVTPNPADLVKGFDKTFEGQEDLDTIRRLLGK